jgi:hypothetical protein
MIQKRICFIGTVRGVVVRVRWARRVACMAGARRRGLAMQFTVRAGEGV